MRKLRHLINKNQSKSALLRFLCRPFYALRNQVQSAAEEVRSVVTTAKSDKTVLSRLRQSYLTETQINRLNLLLKANATRRLIHEYVATDNAAGLYQLAQALDIVFTFEQPISSLRWEHGDCVWVERFPRELQPSLRLLNEAAEDAEQIAEKLLAHDVPFHSKLRRERDFLRRALEESAGASDRQIAFAERAADIDRLLVETPTLTPTRAKNLNAKIAKRATMECERVLFRKIRVAISRALEPHGIDLTDAPMEDTLLLQLVQHINDLDVGVRGHAWKLLKHAVDGTEPQWDEYPVNRDFIADLDRQGVRTRPWLDQNRSVDVPIPSGEEVTLRFSDNAMDYLLMGHHFSTCLSPDDENFFSTIANAMDVNKRVLYARTAAGGIVGRCLMTISIDRELLVYQVYAHHSYRELCAAVKQFAEELARDMNVELASHGGVKSLVVEDWYDDEPIDIRQEAGLPEGSNSIDARPPPTPEFSAGRLGAIDLSGAAPEFFHTLATDYHGVT